MSEIIKGGQFLVEDGRVEETLFLRNLQKSINL